MQKDIKNLLLPRMPSVAAGKLILGGVQAMHDCVQCSCSHQERGGGGPGALGGVVTMMIAVVRHNIIASFGRCTAAVEFLERSVPCTPMWSISCIAGSDRRGGGNGGGVGGKKRVY